LKLKLTNVSLKKVRILLVKTPDFLNFKKVNHKQINKMDTEIKHKPVDLAKCFFGTELKSGVSYKCSHCDKEIKYHGKGYGNFVSHVKSLHKTFPAVYVEWAKKRNTTNIKDYISTKEKWKKRKMERSTSIHTGKILLQL
jgi:hypothetical protein